jgi:hypothetical protein
MFSIFLAAASIYIFYMVFETKIIHIKISSDPTKSNHAGCSDIASCLNSSEEFFGFKHSVRHNITDISIQILGVNISVPLNVSSLDIISTAISLSPMSSVRNKWSNSYDCFEPSDKKNEQMQRYPLFFPSDLKQIMERECISGLCALMVKSAPEEVSNKLDLYQDENMVVLRQKWPGDGRNTEVLGLSEVFVNAEGDVSLCDGATLIKTIGSYGCRDKGFWGNCVDAAPRYDQVIVISQGWGANFFHAMIEDLPRLAVALESLPAWEKPSAWRLHTMLQPPFAGQVADFLGLAGAVGGDIRAARALVPTPTFCGGNVGRRTPARLRDLIRSRLLPPCAAAPPPAAGRRPVLVVFRRPPGRERSLANHDEVVGWARERWPGDVVEHGGDGTFAEQMRVLGRAAGLLGPHGAGLAGMVAMRAGSGVAEAVPETGVNRLNMCFAALAHALGHRYWAVRAPGFDSQGVGALPLASLAALPMWEWAREAAAG